MKGDDIDPAVRSTLDELDLTRRLPAAGPQAPLDMTAAPRMDEVALAGRAYDDRLTKHQGRLEAEGAADPIDDVERGVRTQNLDRGDVST